MGQVLIVLTMQLPSFGILPKSECSSDYLVLVEIEGCSYCFVAWWVADYPIVFALDVAVTVPPVGVVSALPVEFVNVTVAPAIGTTGLEPAT